MTVIGHGYDDNVGAPAFRNVIINGGMSVAQRSSSVASITTDGYYTADRFGTRNITLGTWTQSVENDAPTGSGHRKSLKMLCTTAKASPSAGDGLWIRHKIEGQNLQHFVKGTSSAKTFSLQFWVKANVTGTYTIALYDNDNNRHVGATYTISASATWEKKTVAFAADTSGVFDNDNMDSLWVDFGLGAGSSWTSGSIPSVWGTYSGVNYAVGQVNVAAATNNYWQITGVQLEVGPVATPFEFEPFETTLRKCQRYYEKSYSVNVAPGTNTTEGYQVAWASTQSDGLGGMYVPFKVNKRVGTTYSTTIYTQSGTTNTMDYLRSGVSGAGATTILGAGDSGFSVYCNTGASNATCRFIAHWTVSAEL